MKKSTKNNIAIIMTLITSGVLLGVIIASLPFIPLLFEQLGYFKVVLPITGLGVLSLLHFTLAMDTIRRVDLHEGV